MGLRATLSSAAHSLAGLVNIPFVVGFAAALAWMGTFYSVVAGDGLTNLLTSSAANDVYLSSRIIAVAADAAFALFPRQTLKLLNRSKGHIVSASLMTASALLLALVPLTRNAPVMLLGIGSLFASAASSTFLLCWGITFGSMALRPMFPSLILAYIFMSCTNILFSLSNQYTAVAITLMLPVVSLTCMAIGQRGQGRTIAARYLNPTPASTRDLEKLPRGLFIKLGIVFFVWAAVNRLLRSIYAFATSDDPLVQALMNGLATLVVTVIIAIIIAVMLVRPKKFRFEYAY